MAKTGWSSSLSEYPRRDKPIGGTRSKVGYVDSAAMEKSGTEPRYAGLAGKVVNEVAIILSLSKIRRKGQDYTQFLKTAQCVLDSDEHKAKNVAQKLYTRLKRVSKRYCDADLEVCLDYLKQRVPYLK